MTMWGSATWATQPAGARGGALEGSGPPETRAFHPSSTTSETAGPALFMNATWRWSLSPETEWLPRLPDSERSRGLMMPIMFFIDMV